MFACPNCNRNFPSIISLSLHYRKSYKKPSKELYISLYLKGIEPTCKCGCGISVKFLDITRGFSDFVRGHQSRVKNNFQTEKSITNSLKTRRKMIANGSFKPFYEKETGQHWAFGKTKETDERILKISNSILKKESKTHERSKRMRKGRIDGTISSLFGEDHPMWNGGISSIVNYCYSNKRLYAEWKYPKLVASGFKCEKCNKDGPELHIHHNDEKMNDIIRKILEVNCIDMAKLYRQQNEISMKIKLLVSELVTDYHIKNNISAEVLCEDCHKLYHPKLNF